MKNVSSGLKPRSSFVTIRVVLFCFVCFPVTYAVFCMCIVVLSPSIVTTAFAPVVRGVFNNNDKGCVLVESLYGVVRFYVRFYIYLSDSY